LIAASSGRSNKARFYSIIKAISIKVPAISLSKLLGFYRYQYQVDNGIVGSDKYSFRTDETDRACSGNATQICGGGNRLSYYTWNSTPDEVLYEWKYLTGAAAGQYQFYVPGVVVPLVTVQGVNGKITFLEKFGTGESQSEFCE
jgi:hypothetical protein